MASSHFGGFAVKLLSAQLGVIPPRVLGSGRGKGGEPEDGTSVLTRFLNHFTIINDKPNEFGADITES